LLATSKTTRLARVMGTWRRWSMPGVLFPSARGVMTISTLIAMLRA